MVTLSTVTIQSILADIQAEVFDVQEPQLAGVNDDDIVDDTKPVAYEDTVEEGSDA